MKSVEIIMLPHESEPFEYFCLKCAQLRLWCKEEPLKECGNCGYGLMIRGKAGSLNKDALLAQVQR